MKWIRWLDAAAPLSLIFVLAHVLTRPDYHPTADSYYHATVAQLYAQHGWLSDFRWLEFTVLAPFPNVHWFQHLALAPLAASGDVEWTLRLGGLGLFVALVYSIIAVLKRWGVSCPGMWCTFGLASSPFLLGYGQFLRGGSTFFVLLVWYLDALWTQSSRRTFLLAWLSVYVYVGAPILGLMAAVFAVTDSLRARKISLAPLGTTLAGLAAGHLLNPFWPDHFTHIARELASMVHTDPRLVPGVMRGSEWMNLFGKDALTIGAAACGMWLLLLCRGLTFGGGVPISSRAAAAILIGLGLFFGALLSGAKLLFLFLLMSVLLVPAVAKELGDWPRWSKGGAWCLGALLAYFSLQSVWQDRGDLGAPAAKEYAALGSFLAGNSEKGEVVVAAWDDFPGLFAYDRRNHYVVGMNTEFLLYANPQRFDAFFELFSGQAKAPEELLSKYFRGARLIVLRREVRNAGEAALLGSLTNNVHFRELKSPTAEFRVFELKNYRPPQTAASEKRARVSHLAVR